MKARLQEAWRSRQARAVLALAVSAGCLALALRNVSLAEVGGALAQADPRYVLLALASVAVNTLAKAFRWQILLAPSGKKIGLGQNLSALLVGQMFNNLLPARIGDLSRAVMLGSLGAGKSFVLGTVVVEKVLDMVAYAGLFVILLLLAPLPTWINSSGYTFAGVTVVVALVTLGVAYERRWVLDLIQWGLDRLPPRWQNYLAGRLRAGLSSLDVFQDRKGLAGLAWWTAVTWGTALLNNYLALAALGITVPLAASLLVLVALMAGISLPSVPGKIGIFEYICVLALSIYGAAPAQALSYGFLLHAIVFIPATLLGLGLFWGLGLRVRDIRMVEP